MSDDRPWRQFIGEASFRGIVFEVENVQGTFGRRGTLHEFPFKNTPFAEDTGAKAFQITIQAFVDGDNYIQRREELIRAIQEVSTPGELILKTGDRLLAKPTASCSFTDNNRKGGFTRFLLQFVQAGENEFPQATTNTKETSDIRAQEVANTVIEEAGGGINFEQTLPDSTEGINDPDSLADESIQIVNTFNASIDEALNTGEKVGDAIDEFTRKFNNYKDDARANLLDPTDFLTDTDTIYGDLLSVWSTDDLPAAYDALRDVFNSSVDNIAKVVSLNDPAREQQDINNQLLRDGLRNLVIRRISEVTVEQTYSSTNEVNERKTSILDLFEQQIENASDNGDQQQRDSLVDLRSSVLEDLNSKVGNLPDEVELTLNDATNVFTLANKLYGDALRGEEISDTNGIINPVLVPAQETLNVLSA